tara:strand:+ start:310 stop:774 length:465 start_codon:yes stop_codon:yes gene_type:complete
VQIVDSNQKKLDIHEILVIALNETVPDGLEFKKVMATILTEVQRKTCEVVKVGNTVFIGHRGEGKNKNKMAGKSFNVDTGKNEIKNILEYFAYIQGQGITHFSALFNDSDLIPSMRVVHKRLQDTDTEFAIGRTKEDTYSLYVKFGEELLSERF